jgi:hypothetical protein
MPNTFIKTFANIYSHTDSHDLNQQKYIHYKQYKYHPLTLTTSFIGIPNRDLTIDGKQSFKNIIKNIFGWHGEDAPKWQIVLDYMLIKPLIVFLINVFLILFKLSINIVRLVTELFPDYLKNLCKEALGEASEEREISKQRARALFRRKTTNEINHLSYKPSGWLLIAATVGYWFFNILSIVGHAITDPLPSIIRAVKKKQPMVAVASACISIVFYALLLPVMMYLIGPLIFAHTASLLPAALPVGEVIQFFATVFTPLGIAVNWLLISVLKISLVAISNAAIGIASITGLSATGITSAVGLGLEKLDHWYHTHFKKNVDHSSFLETAPRTTSSSKRILSVSRTISRTSTSSIEPTHSDTSDVTENDYSMESSHPSTIQETAESTFTPSPN